MSRQQVQLSEQAERDYDEIVEWTARTFGARQAKKYENLLIDSLESLTHDPIGPRSRDRADHLGRGYRSMRMQRPGRHILIYHVQPDRIVIVRILHDSMDLSRHFPTND